MLGLIEPETFGANYTITVFIGIATFLEQYLRKVYLYVDGPDWGC
jgi:hypothetical protein